MNFQDYEKIRTSLRYWLLGRKYHVALKAMEFGLSYHVGKRKNGAPEFIHQVSQCQYARTLESELMFPEPTFCTIFLHDIVEDHKVPLRAIQSEFGDQIGHAVELMTDSRDGKDKNLEDYFAAMAGDALASFAKGADRMHNYQTMIGVFNPNKQLDYLMEGENHILPMLKHARKNFPQQEAAYQNVKHILQMQIELIRRLNDPAVQVQ